MSQKVHLQDLDWLRGYAMLLGVPFHVGLIYAVGNEWFVASPDKSVSLTWLTGVLTSFRMPLFFIISGLLSAMVLTRRDPMAWLRKRFVRLMVPFVCAIIVISPTVIWLIAMMAAEADPSISTSQRFADLITSFGMHWIGHLWFLEVLMIFSIITYLARSILLRISDVIGKHFVLENGELMGKLIWGTLIACVIYKVGVEAGSFILERLIPDIYIPLNETFMIEVAAQFAPYYFIGYLLYQRQLPRIHRQVLPWILIGMAAVVYAAVWNNPANMQDKFLTYVSGTILAVLVSFAAMSWARVNIRDLGPFGKAVVSGSFSIYLFHYPICVYIGHVFKGVDAPIMVEYLLNIGLTIGISLLIHWAFIDRFAIMRFLFNGASSKTTPKQAPSHPAQVSK